MSCTLIVVPVLMGAWPVLAAATATAAVGLGYGLSKEEKDARAVAATEHTVEFHAGTCSDGEGRAEQTFVREGIRIAVRVQNGELRVRVDGKRSCAELEAIGRDFLARTKQAFAYETTRAEYESRGFVLVGEEKDAAGRVRVRFRRLR